MEVVAEQGQSKHRENQQGQYSDESSDGESMDLHESSFSFSKRLNRGLFVDEDSCTVNAEPIRASSDELRALEGMAFLDATVGAVLLIGLRQLVKLRPPRPREWLAFYLLSRKGAEEDDTCNIMKSQASH